LQKHALYKDIPSYVEARIVCNCAEGWLGNPQSQSKKLDADSPMTLCLQFVDKGSVESISHMQLDHVSDIHRHLLDLCVVVFLDVFHYPHIIVCHEVDRHTFASKTSTASDAVQVVL